MKANLTVFFEDPFWVGVFERIEDGKLSVCKVTFGADPKDYEVLDYILYHYYGLFFSPAIETEIRQTADNPKRRLRNARKHLENTGIGTKSRTAASSKQAALYDPCISMYSGGSDEQIWTIMEMDTRKGNGKKMMTEPLL